MSNFPLPHATRNQVFEALFTLVKTITPPGGRSWALTSQWFRMWDTLNEGDQPALFLVRGPQTSEQKHAFGVTKLHWKANLWIYYRTDGYKTQNTYPDQLTDPLLDSIEQTFQTDPNVGRLTLGDLVWHCWIDGTIFWEPGLDTDNQAVLVVPISILI